uniref:NBS-LRR protein n=1 Tax=Cicer arietinum TaxID=3827 RepID=W0M064_CICAR|nr:NBS-LRR protein [Cicer arietinum]
MSSLKVETVNTTTLDPKKSYPLISQSNVPQIHKYEVFVSFRGPDIREVFLGHLVKEFNQKKIVAFIDEKLKQGDEIGQSLFEAIETSLISVVIFSPNYASSEWCLDELVKIIECREKDGQIVLPVFYKVDPTNVRHQDGVYADAFDEHETKHGNASNNVLGWRYALKKSGNIAGFHSLKFWNDAELVEKIVDYVLRRLGQVRSVNSQKLIGIEKHISKVESLLQVHSRDVRAIGIWGMGGIGKTTIAQEVYSRLCSEYEGCYFKANVREVCGRVVDIISLKKDLFSTLLDENNSKIDIPYGLHYSVERRIRRMKVLVVLDDISSPQQLEILIGSLDLFGPGSRIILTTRNKQVLANWVVEKDIYKVKPLDFDDSFRLFTLNAFGNKDLQKDYHDLSKKVVKYAQGIPIVLHVLAHHLKGKDKKIWEGQLQSLTKKPIPEVHDVVRLSYSDLDRDEKNVLLDIAFFFDGLHLKVNQIKSLVKAHGYSVDVELENLKNKALITISPDNVVSMHSIIQETAWEIVREESFDNPGIRSRLLNPDDIYKVLNNDKGSETIRSIAIDLTTIKKMQINPHVFDKMKKLQYLDIYSKGYCCVFLQNRQSFYLPQGLESLPNELRYLRWAHYPLESLPSKFNGEKLVVLNLQYSQVKKLWYKQKDLKNLKYLILSLSSHLLELPDLSKATNLAVIDLRLCTGLTSVHPSVFSLNKLDKLDLGGCFSLTSLRTNIRLTSLRYLSLAGCIALNDFSVISTNMIKLNLEHTGIKQLPSSIGLQTKLEKLLLAHSYIKKLPQSIKHLSRLQHLDVHHCRELQSIPELPSSLKTLDASGCVSLETVIFPSTAIEQQKENKTKVTFWNCLKLDQDSLKAIELNAQINMMNFAYNHHIATSGDQDYDGKGKGTYVYPGSSVPEWNSVRTLRATLHPIAYPQKCVEGYIQWYYRISHPRRIPYVAAYVDAGPSPSHDVGPDTRCTQYHEIGGLIQQSLD